MTSGIGYFLLLAANLLLGVAIGWLASRRLKRAAPAVGVPDTEAAAAILDEVKANARQYDDDLKSFGSDIADEASESAIRGQLENFQQRNSAYQEHLHTGVTRLSQVASLGDEVLRQVVFELVRHTSDICQFGLLLEEKLAGQIPDETRQIIGSAIGELLSSNQRLEGELEAARHELDHHRKELSEAKREARVDPLTKVANRRGFDEQLASIHARYLRDDVGYAIAMLDVDHFKKINDTYGHLAGDAVLEVIGHLMSTTIRPYDTAARVGGEEFAILLPATTAKDAMTVAERCRKKIEAASVRISGESVTFRVSVGVASTRAGDTDPMKVMNRADAALYLAKESGRNQVRIADFESAA